MTAGLVSCMLLCSCSHSYMAVFCSSSSSSSSSSYYKTIKVQMLCCLAATPSQLKIIIISIENTVIPRLTKIIRSRITFVSRNVISYQPSRVGGSPLCDVVSSFLCHTYTDGKDKLLEWPERSCVLLYVSARID